MYAKVLDALRKSLETFLIKPKILRLFLTTAEFWSSNDILKSTITPRSLVEPTLSRMLLSIEYDVSKVSDPLANGKKLHLLSLTLSPFIESKI